MESIYLAAVSRCVSFDHPPRKPLVRSTECGMDGGICVLNPEEGGKGRGTGQ